MRKAIFVFVALAIFGLLAGCSDMIEPKEVYNEYDLTVVIPKEKPIKPIKEEKPWVKIISPAGGEQYKAGWGDDAPFSDLEVGMNVEYEIPTDESFLVYFVLRPVNNTPVYYGGYDSRFRGYQIGYYISTPGLFERDTRYLTVPPYIHTGDYRLGVVLIKSNAWDDGVLASDEYLATAESEVFFVSDKLGYDSDRSPDYSVIIPEIITEEDFPDLYNGWGWTQGIYNGMTEEESYLWTSDGAVTSVNWFLSEYYDHCLDASQLNEAYVIRETGRIASITVTCPNGCEYDACIR